jgi:hypothetical protein
MAAKSWSLSTPADDALKNTVPGLIRDVKEHAFTASGFYAEQQSTPDQTIAIYAGIVYFGITKVEYAGLDIVDLGTGGGFETTALTASYYNKVLFTIDSSGTLEATEGTEHAVLASVVEPAIPAGKFPICMVSVQDDGTATAGTILSIEQSEIKQLQGTNLLSTIATDPTWAAAGDLVQGTGNDTAAVLSLGAANLKAFVNAGATAIEWAGGMKIGTLTYDLTTASGDVGITSVGFKPSHVIFLAAVESDVNSLFSIGFSDGTVHYALGQAAITAPYMVVPTNVALYYRSATADYQLGIVKTMDVDGFTITWTKTGTPTGTLGIHYMAFR